ncbi:MAG TPA: hypothetical protein DD730_02795 [Desulfosporosinus sp.]|nr:hypothetical protein [Desulfosporosinus sp.]
MQKIYKILGSIALLLITVTLLIVSFWFILGAVAVVTLLGIYRYFFMKRKPGKFQTKPYNHMEIIDLKAEEVHETIQNRKPDGFK